MRHYLATHIATGQRVEYDADLPMPEHQGQGWILEDISTAAQAPDASPAPPPDYPPIAKLAFRNRFTATEKAGIELACLDPAAGTEQERLLAASLRAVQSDLAAASVVHLGSAQTRAGVEAMEYLGLISVGRAAVILDTPPADYEIANGQ
jgi:hypothetical protein